MNILVADDDPIALELVKESLLADGHTVTTATNGREALGLLRSGHASVLISDWEMPEMTGPELCRAIRSLDLGRYMYAILLTSRANRDDLVEGLRAGADDFLTKPFDPMELSVRLSVAERITSLETRDLMIFGMAKLAESRDSDTGSHLERVRAYCRVLAEHLMRQKAFDGLVDAEFVRNIYLTSPLHDIGKVGIPDAILLKDGKLTPEQFTVMKMHVEIGRQTLDAALKEYPHVRFLEMARDIAWAHHERWNGTGYPRGLTGEAIPLAARIVALADVYDALRSQRVYKPALDHVKTREAIVTGAGKHFDPQIVAAFLAVEDQFESICQRLKDEAPDTYPMAA
jgi:putative two-component system response regulator